MNNTTTHDQLIKYLYRETSKKEGAQVKLTRIMHSDFYQEWHESRLIKNELNACLIAPSRSTTQSILAYARCD